MKFNVICLLVLGLFVGVELGARYYGLNKFPLFISDKNYEYIHAPNQNTQIYRNKFVTNSYSMRSLEPEKSDSLVFLLLGDSIINGGNQTDHESLGSTLIQNLLSTRYKHSKAFNISSYTWGASNIYEYLKKHGSFNARYVIIFHNAGDAFDYMTFNDSENLGSENGRPTNNYFFASVKLIEMIYLRFVKDKLFTTDIVNDHSRRKDFDNGFENLYRYCNNQKLPIIVYMHADLDELKNTQYNFESRLIINFYLILRKHT